MSHSPELDCLSMHLHSVNEHFHSYFHNMQKISSVGIFKKKQAISKYFVAFYLNFIKYLKICSTINAFQNYSTITQISISF